MLKRMFRNNAFRVTVEPKGKDEFVPEDSYDERDPLDIVQITQGVADVVSTTAVTIFTLAAAYKVLDTVCKVIVKKV